MLTIPSITNYNLVIAVLSMFFMLIKGIMYMLHVLPPIVSVVLHLVLIILYAVAVSIQASSDTSDPRHPQNGPAWYITKSCSVAHNRNNIGYCQQAKATFACFVAMLGVFSIYFLLSAWSCIPSKAQIEEYEEKKRQKKLRWAHLDEPDARSANSGYQHHTPDTPGVQFGMSPYTPRTLAFNTLGGTEDLPLRSTEKTTTTTQSSSFSLRSPGILRTPMTLGPKSPRQPTTPRLQEKGSPLVHVSEQTLSPNSGVDMYFPPPPKESDKKGKR